MEFLSYVKGVKADVAKKELTLTFTVHMDEESLVSAEELAQFAGEDAGAVELRVMPYKRSFLTKDVTLTARKSQEE